MSRLSVCYVAPGQDLVSSAGPTRNVLNLARALSQWADVSVAFRSIRQGSQDSGVPVLEIWPAAQIASDIPDDSAVRGIGYGEFLTYLRTLRRFARERLQAFDVVLEKSWFLSGYVSAFCRDLGLTAIPVENLVPILGKGADRSPAAYVRHGIGRWLAGHYLRQAPRLIAETEHLKAAMIDRWGIDPGRISVVGLGVDRALFQSRDQGAARQELGIPLEATIALYVGILDRAHDLSPFLDALHRMEEQDLELHVVGDGPMLAEYEARSAGVIPSVHFHGRVGHERVPVFIAASDLCLAPYDPGSFPGGQVGYSTLKIREYLSSGRPVASVHSGSIPGLIRHGETGFLLENGVREWTQLLKELPPRQELARMGATAATVELAGWEQTARAYHRVIESEVGDHRRRDA